MAQTNEDTKGERRERKRRKKRYGHKVSGRSVQTLQRVIVERAKEVEERGRGMYLLDLGALVRIRRISLMSYLMTGGESLRATLRMIDCQPYGADASKVST